MKEVSAKPKPKISPFTLIISGAGLIACVYLLFSSQPPASAPPQNNTANGTSETGLSGLGKPTSVIPPSATPPASPPSPASAAMAQTAGQPDGTNRDPFLPGITKAEAKNISNPKTAPARPLFSGANTKAPVAKDDRLKPVWNGTIGIAGDQVVLINFRGKPYILHLGDPIPGTDYLIAEIDNNFIMLNSSKKNLRLYLRKEAPLDKTKSL